MVIMDQFLAPESDIKHKFLAQNSLAPETDTKCQFLVLAPESDIKHKFLAQNSLAPETDTKCQFLVLAPETDIMGKRNYILLIVVLKVVMLCWSFWSCRKAAASFPIVGSD